MFGAGREHCFFGEDIRTDALREPTHNVVCCSKSGVAAILKG